MSSRWDRDGELERLAGDIEDLALGIRVRADELSDPHRVRLLLATARLAGELSHDLDDVDVLRELIRIRTITGLAAARAIGRRGGRPRVLTPAEVRQIRLARGQRPPVAVSDLARAFGVGRTTIYRAIERLSS